MTPVTLPLLLASLVLALAACAPPEPEPEAAGDAAEAMAREHAGDQPVPSAATEPEPARPVSTERVAYATLTGQQITGYLARPLEGAAGAPGLIVIHEWWGLNDNIEAMTRRLAGEGYVALAVDLYQGRSATDPEEARELTQGVSEEGAASNLRQAYRYLTGEAGASTVGVIGWCFGGRWSLSTALLLGDDIDAAVIYYGRPVTDRQQLAALEAPVLGLFGAEDQAIPVAQVRELDAALGELGKEAEIHIYDGAGHAFANPSGGRYQPQAAEDAWQKTLAFLAEHLKPGGTG